MRIIKPSFKIETRINGEAMLKRIETAGRTCYKSEDKITLDSAKGLVRAIIKRGHHSVLEHESIRVRFICDRGVTHEIVRHRIASYSQESTRYCNYSKKKFGREITVIDPGDLLTTHKQKLAWFTACMQAEEAYFDLIDSGAKPQMARSVLPNSLKTEIVMTANLREWRHFFHLRTADDAHPQMCELTRPLLREFRHRIPVIFDDVGVTE